MWIRANLSREAELQLYQIMKMLAWLAVQLSCNKSRSLDNPTIKIAYCPTKMLHVHVSVIGRDERAKNVIFKQKIPIVLNKMNKSIYM